MKTLITKNFISLVFFGILILYTSEVACQWEIVNPSPFIDNLYVFYADSEKCNIITERGMIINTSNFGNSWEYSFSVLPVNSINFYLFNKNHGWATTEYVNFRTLDGGQTWENMGNPLLYSNWDIFFDDTLSGWSVGNHHIKSTTDGGYSWDTYDVSLYSQLTFISRYDDSTLISGGAQLFRTTNNGENWHSIPTPNNFYCSGFVCGKINNTPVGFLTGSILGNNTVAVILKTTDAGDSWNYVLYDTGRSGVGLTALNDNLLITCGLNKVLRSTDFGESWDSTSIPIDDYLLPNNIYFATDEIIYISGQFGNLVRSTDAGKSFEVLSHNNLYKNINDFSFGDSLTGYFATWDAKIYKTSDAGESFIDITPNEIWFPFYKIQAVSNSMVAAIAGRQVYITRDGGLSWNIITYNSNYSPSVVYFVDSSNGWILYYPNLIRRTTDGGENWYETFLNDTVFVNVSTINFADELVGFLSNSNGFYKTTNGGEEWNIVNNFVFSEIEFLDRENGIATNYQSAYYTSDGGNIWEKIDSIHNVYEFDLEKNGTGSVLMMLNVYFLYTSFDLGRTWKMERIPVNELCFLSVSDPHTVWISSYTGQLIKYYIPSNPSSVESENEKNISFKLLQNYPNPFNPLTTILYKIPEGGNVTLKVFDILGREIKTLIDENKIAGEYKIEFDASSLPSGVYIYKIQVNDFVLARKMVLLK